MFAPDCPAVFKSWCLIVCPTTSVLNFNVCMPDCLCISLHDLAYNWRLISAPLLRPWTTWRTTKAWEWSCPNLPHLIFFVTLQKSRAKPRADIYRAGSRSRPELWTATSPFSLGYHWHLPKLMQRTTPFTSTPICYTLIWGPIRKLENCR